jgi:hypothetical protein
MSPRSHDLIGQLAQLVHAAGRHGHTYAFGGQGFGDTTPNAHAGPGHQSGFVFELQVHEGSHLKINVQMYCLNTWLYTSIKGWGHHK